MYVTHPDRPSTLTFQMNGATVTACLPDPALARELAGIYPTCVVEGAAPGEPDIVVRQARGAYELASARVSNAGLSGRELLPAFEWAVTLALLAGTARYVHVHAAGAVRRNRALLVLGPTGAGKSTLALHWSQAGAPVLGDDTVLLDETGRVHPFPRLFKIDPVAITRAGVRLERTPWWSPGSSEAWYDPADTGGWGSSAPIALVAVVERGGEGTVLVRDVTRRQGLAALLRSCQATGRTGTDAFDALTQAASGARFVALRYRRSDHAARTLIELLS